MVKSGSIPRPLGAVPCATNDDDDEGGIDNNTNINHPENHSGVNLRLSFPLWSNKKIGTKEEEEDEWCSDWQNRPEQQQKRKQHAD